MVNVDIRREPTQLSHTDEALRDSQECHDIAHQDVNVVHGKPEHASVTLRGQQHVANEHPAHEHDPAVLFPVLCHVFGKLHRANVGAHSAVRVESDREPAATAMVTEIVILSSACVAKHEVFVKRNGEVLRVASVEQAARPERDGVVGVDVEVGLQVVGGVGVGPGVAGAPQVGGPGIRSDVLPENHVDVVHAGAKTEGKILGLRHSGFHGDGVGDGVPAELEDAVVEVVDDGGAESLGRLGECYRVEVAHLY